MKKRGRSRPLVDYAATRGRKGKQAEIITVLPGGAARDGRFSISATGIIAEKALNAAAEEDFSTRAIAADRENAGSEPVRGELLA
ncbi:MAG: hypothetical protein J0I77_10075 [Rudaea sp.]|uniref:hypothetical protein n=1 Tax=unclassified Rudaea TaxID=2627037 RepID=UPI0010F4E0DB|nr:MULTISPECIES: hypothetical protein [unclassified Rudaea]MBN8886056.1 hypothetical protein [Rudaea sp.]MBR0346616.1 hypothetical protein [Rudaea sp.]